MRSDLEAAMAAVIGSRYARDRFADDPFAFATEFSLEPVECEMLLEMGSDLTALTDSFVSKRSGTLRWNARRTINLLGQEGESLVEEFVETHPASDRFRLEAARFGDFVVERVEERQDGTQRARVIAEMARFERHRSDSFWDATKPTEPEEATSVPGAGRHHSGAVRLRAGANVGQFNWDLRLLYHRDIEPWSLLRPDPCPLLFFHNGRSDGMRIIRLRPEEALVVGAIGPRDAEPVDALREAIVGDVDVDHLLDRLAGQEVVAWA
jgi:hypothetical protein